MTVLSSSWCKQTVNCTDDECHKKGYVNNIKFTTFFLASFKYNFEMKLCVSFTRSVLCGKLLAVEEDILYSIAKYKQGIVYTSEVVIGKPFFTVHLTLFSLLSQKVQCSELKKIAALMAALKSSLLQATFKQASREVYLKYKKKVQYTHFEICILTNFLLHGKFKLQAQTLIIFWPFSLTNSL